MFEYDYVIVGAGLFGCVCAERLKESGKKVLVVEKSGHIGGTCYTKEVDGIMVHMNGAHIFRTNNQEIYEYLLRFCKLNRFINSPVAIVNGKAYNLPFNMNTFAQVFNIVTPLQAREAIDKDRKNFHSLNPKNLEEWALDKVGPTIYTMFIKGYTEKQWGRPCKELPASTMKRIPLRFTYDNNYFDAEYQGIPTEGYTAIFEKMLSGVDVKINEDFNQNRDKYFKLGRKVIYTGPIDELLDYQFGALEYRGLIFETKKFDTDNYQGNAVLNYCDLDVPYTRSIEHKHFVFGKQPNTVVSFEYPSDWKLGDYPYYPVNDEKNDNLYQRYQEEVCRRYNDKIILGGRLGKYKYFDMQDTIAAALDLCLKLKGESK